jgi:hypothetical protein
LKNKNGILQIFQFDNVGAKASGKISRHCKTSEGNFAIKMDAFVTDQSFKHGDEKGIKSFKFRNPVNCISKDYSYIKEKIAADMMNAAGVLTNQVAFTDLYINEKYFGLYLVEDDFDHAYLKNRGHDLVNHVFNDSLGKSVSQYGNLLSITHPAERLQVVEIVDQLLNKNLSADYLESKFYFESFVRMDLINSIIGNNDGFPRNNFLIYQSPVTMKWAPIAHDFDLAFSPSYKFYSFLGEFACLSYKKLLDEWIPVFGKQIPMRVTALAQIANSSISHPVQLNAFAKLESSLENLLNYSHSIVFWKSKCLH